MSDENEPDIGTGAEVEEVEEPTLDYGEWNGVDQMESLCMGCGADGITRIMLQKIPHFRELIIASFACEECGERNNEVSFGGEIQVQGVINTLQIKSSSDMNRQIIKSNTAALKVVELDFEIPPKTQKGGISTIEGMLSTAAKNLAIYQKERMEENEVVGQKVAEIIAKLSMMSIGMGPYPFTLVLDDPAGNSYIENPVAPQKDPAMTSKQYFRSPDQDLLCGLQPDKGLFRDDKESNYQALVSGPGFGAVKDDVSDGQNVPNSIIDEDGAICLGRSEPISIPSNCPNCTEMGESLTALTEIPHFKEVIIMAFVCKHCGFKDNEIKAGGAVPQCGTSVTLTVTNEVDMKRDVLKSDTTAVFIPEIDLELQCGTLGGLFTTIEGLLVKIQKNLTENHPFYSGDSSTLNHADEGNEFTASNSKYKQFLDSLEDLVKARTLPFTIELRDPMGNSFISARLGAFLPPEMDQNLKMVSFVRTWDENEDFGLNDINTQDFETGVDHSSPILPDRVLRVHKKGADHPTPFAKGMIENDTTEGGIPGSSVPNTSQPSSAAGDASGEAEYCQPPKGWGVERVDGVFSTEEAEENSSNTEEGAGAGVPDGSGNDGTEEGLLISGRVFNDDSGIQFDPREEFAGRREDCVYRLGSQGLGYYQDARRGATEVPRLLKSI